MTRTYIAGIDEIPRHLNLWDNDELNINIVVRPGYTGDVNMEIDLLREGVKLDMAGIFLCSSAERINMNITVRHLIGGCTSRQLFKGVVGGKSKVRFNGLVYVDKDAQGTKAYQECHTLLLDDSARMETSPQLALYADDVECSHGATTGFLNQDEQFYMRSRGIPEKEAKYLQMISFLSPVMDRLNERQRKFILDNL